MLFTAISKDHSKKQFSKYVENYRSAAVTMSQSRVDHMDRDEVTLTFQTTSFTEDKSKEVVCIMELYPSRPK